MALQGKERKVPAIIVRGICQTRPDKDGYQEIKYESNGKQYFMPRVRYIIDGHRPIADELPYCDEASSEES
jgi:hypothetical protein